MKDEHISKNLKSIKLEGFWRNGDRVYFTQYDSKDINLATLSIKDDKMWLCDISSGLYIDLNRDKLNLSHPAVEYDSTSFKLGELYTVNKKKYLIVPTEIYSKDRKRAYSSLEYEGDIGYTKYNEEVEYDVEEYNGVPLVDVFTIFGYLVFFALLALVIMYIYSIVTGKEF
jgi:hypothetical protein